MKSLRITFIIIAFIAVSRITFFVCAGGLPEPPRRYNNPEIVASKFIKNSCTKEKILKSVLMSDCRGKALVYITTNKDKYKVRLTLAKEKGLGAWFVESASSFDNDTIEHNAPPCKK